MSEGLTIETATKFFLDRESVATAAGKMEQRSLSTIGAHVRTRDQRSQRPGGKKGAVSRPGESPRTHENPLLRKFTYFVFDPVTRTVVIGPVLLNGSRRKTSQTVPNILEYGGDTQKELVELTHGLIVPAGSALAKKSSGRRFTQKSTILARPHTHPAFEAELPKMPDAFKGEFNNG